MAASEGTSHYAESISEWLRQCYYLQCVHASFPSYLLSQLRQDVAFHPRPTATAQDTARSQANGTEATTPLFTLQGGREYKVPKVWKRFTAELVDFAILFLLKLFITFIVMDFFNIVDLDKFNFSALQENTLDYKFALQITSEIFVLELIHRVVVCFFEALCLHQGTNGVGGATPGKSLLGIRVVSCATIVPLQGTRIIVWPAEDMGFGWALLRSVIKNFAMAFFFPACITMFIFPYHRTMYDIVCGCIVVEDVRQQNQF